MITEANLGRQLFAESELGLHKSVALINRANRFFGTDWKAETQKFELDSLNKMPDNGSANIYISCVDNVEARFGIAEILNKLNTFGYYSNRAYYWIDFGNSQYTGQVLLSTIGNISQPKSEKYKTIENLPFVTEEFGELLKQSEVEDDTRGIQDFTEAPQNLAELQNIMMRAEQIWDEVPKNIKLKFDNDVDEFIASFGTVEWAKNLGIYQEKKAEPEATKTAETAEAKE